MSASSATGGPAKAVALVGHEKLPYEWGRGVILAAGEGAVDQLEQVAVQLAAAFNSKNAAAVVLLYDDNAV